MFALIPTGTNSQETVLYKFGGSPSDGSNPAGGLRWVDGTFYGTTQYGGKYNFGTIFTISTSGKERVIWSFAGPPGDGAYPVANLVPLNCPSRCEIYGVTSQGGTANVGTIFKLVPGGTKPLEQPVHSFTQAEGDSPVGLAAHQSMLYGAASADGADKRGSLFSFDAQASSSSQPFQVIHSFRGFDKDGALPYGRPLLYNGVLYGTTREAGNGTIYKDPISGSL